MQYLTLFSILSLVYAGSAVTTKGAQVAKAAEQSLPSVVNAARQPAALQSLNSLERSSFVSAASSFSSEIRPALNLGSTRSMVSNIPPTAHSQTLQRWNSVNNLRKASSQAGAGFRQGFVSTGKVIGATGKVIGEGATIGAKSAANGAAVAGQSVANGARVAGQSVANGARVAGQSVANGARAVGESVTNGARVAGQSAANGARAVGQSVANGARVAGQSVANGAQTAGRTVATSARVAGQSISNGAKVAGQSISNGAQAAGKSIANGAQTAGTFASNHKGALVAGGVGVAGLTVGGVALSRN